MPARLVERIGAHPRLAALATPIAERIRPAFDRRVVKQAMSGGWLGHRLHPMLTDVVIGSWSSAAILDWCCDEAGDRGADRLVATGLLASVPTALTGLSDWTDVYGRARSIGLLHAASNLAASVLHAASLIERRRGRRGRGRWLGLAGVSVMGVGGYLGGHLSYVNGVGVDHSAFNTGPSDWTAVLDEAELPLAQPRSVRVGEREVLLVRRGDGIRAFDARCTHAGWSLAGGQVEPGENIAAGWITCPAHGSVFSLADGSVRRGPAASPQRQLDVRVVDGRVEVRET